MSVTGMLKGHDLFRALTPKELDQVSSFSAVRNFEKDQTVFDLDQRSSHVFQVLEGEIYLQLPGALPEFNIIVSQVERGELFGLSPLLGSSRYTASARCINRCSVLAIEAEAFRRLLQENALVGFHIMSRVADTYFHRYVEVVKNLQGVLGQIPMIR
ncbi:MAG: cyclic nucleotide-binding domain-containing protein [Deltaproteobacteria bacterium]|nr:cyclic nucleotide-binding domain-containing protein [Deltaproteobacteria bacterium]